MKVIFACALSLSAKVSMESGEFPGKTSKYDDTLWLAGLHFLMLKRMFRAFLKKDAPFHEVMDCLQTWEDYLMKDLRELLKETDRSSLYRKLVRTFHAMVTDVEARYDVLEETAREDIRNINVFYDELERMCKKVTKE